MQASNARFTGRVSVLPSAIVANVKVLAAYVLGVVELLAVGPAANLVVSL